MRGNQDYPRHEDFEASFQLYARRRLRLRRPECGHRFFQTSGEAVQP